jgi:Rrf2 family protein
MLEIALDETDSGVFQKDISDRQQISLKYLDNIIAALKTAGLIINKKGKKSGYRLTRKPDEIKLLDIFHAFEPGISVVDCVTGNFDCPLSGNCNVRNFWSGLNNLIINYFDSYTLEDLIRGYRKNDMNSGRKISTQSSL